MSAFWRPTTPRPKSFQRQFGQAPHAVSVSSNEHPTRSKHQVNPTQAPVSDVCLINLQRLPTPRSPGKSNQKSREVASGRFAWIFCYEALARVTGRETKRLEE